ncbi:MAG: transcriptional regulator [Rhodospirillales bacterium]
MDIKPIKSDTDFSQALARIEHLMRLSPKTGTPEFDELEVLSILAERYEEERFSVDMPDPVEAIKFRMEQQGLRAKDLVPIFGSSGRVSEILNRRRSLSLGMIRRLAEKLGLQPGILLKEYPLDKPR